MTVWIFCVWVGFSFMGCASAPEQKSKVEANKPTSVKYVDPDKDNYGY